MKLSFTGELLKEQTAAIKNLTEHETGVLSAPPGSGKTVIGCAIIAKRKMDGGWFLKTIIPSRKMTKYYGDKKHGKQK